MGHTHRKSFEQREHERIRHENYFNAAKLRLKKQEEQKENNFEKLLSDINKCSEFFIRDPKTFIRKSKNDEKAALEYAKHCLAKYKIPKILKDAPLSENQEYFYWYIK